MNSVDRCLCNDLRADGHLVTRPAPLARTDEVALGGGVHVAKAQLALT